MARILRRSFTHLFFPYDGHFIGVEKRTDFSTKKFLAFGLKGDMKRLFVSLSGVYAKI